ncbi:hypothetical protein [Clostridium ihumii]
MEDYKKNYKVADVGSVEQEAINKCEKIVKEETGKDFVMIAWEKK